MAWKIHQESGHLILGRPKQPIGWVLVDETGHHYLGEHGAIWIVQSKAEALSTCAELNRRPAVGPQTD